MDKFLTIFRISMQQEFAYRINFIMWRVRNVVRIFLIFFLWDAVFANPDTVLFGYDRSKILTYVFGLIIVRAFVMSARSVDVSGDIASGRLSMYLLKPINYFRYWMTRDISSKTLNLGFAVVETAILYVILRPPFFIQTDPSTLALFLLTLVFAMVVYFLVLFITNLTPLWYPEVAWGGQFIIMATIIPFLSGLLFPLDVLPSGVQNVLNLTPFPYLIFFPIQVYLGNVAGAEILRGLVITGVWIVLLWVFMNRLWKRGLKVYQGYGI